jgi:hypothetical protein
MRYPAAACADIFWVFYELFDLFNIKFHGRLAQHAKFTRSITRASTGAIGHIITTARIHLLFHLFSSQ